MPKVFISHSWEDNDISRKLAAFLKRDGAEVWIDYARISGGDSLPEIIGEAIEWCDTLILVWSKSAADSYYVREEWTCAHTNKKRITPCIIDNTKLPTILTSKLFIDFENFERGYHDLARALKLTVQEKVEKPKSSESIPPKIKTKEADKISEPGKSKKEYPEKKKSDIKETPNSVPKKQTEPAIKTAYRLKRWHKSVGISTLLFCLLIVGYFALNPLDSSLLLFRDRPDSLSEDNVKAMLKKYNFFDSYRYKEDNGFLNQFKSLTINADTVVIDSASGLMWQQGGSSEYMVYEDAKRWIKDLNQKGHAGFNDWRLPTLEEAMSLMEPEKKNGYLYIDPVFDQTQTWIWTADGVKGEPWAWVVRFDTGGCDYDGLGDYGYVRAVRSGQSSEE